MAGTEPVGPIPAEEAARAWREGRIDLDTLARRLIEAAEHAPPGIESDALRFTAARIDTIRYGVCSVEQPAAVEDALGDWVRLRVTSE